MKNLFHLFFSLALFFPKYFFIPLILIYFFKIFIPFSPHKLRINIWVLIILIYGLVVFSYSYFNNNDLIILLTESKILLPVFLLSFKYKLKINYDVLSRFIIIVFFLTLFHAMVFYNVIFRYMDIYQNYTGMISIYYGFLLIFLMYNCSSKKILYLLVLCLLITGSGSAILASIPVIYYKFRTQIQGKFLFFFISLIIISLFVYTLIITQISRGRSLDTFETIDRFILISSYLKYLFNEFNFKLFLIGNGLGQEMNFLLKYMNNPIFEGYIMNESKYISGKNLHNEFFRIFSNFGLPFLILLILQIKKIFPKPLFLSFIIACLFNSIIYPTFFSILIISQINKHDVQTKRI